MLEISYSEQSSASVRNTFRDDAYLVLQIGSSLPDICVACGNPAFGNVIHKEFDDRDLWWVLPTPLDVIYVISQSAELICQEFCSWHTSRMAPDDQHAVLSLNLTGNLSRQAPVAGIDLARFQRTSKGA
jgi:hypothetical protein